MGSTYKRLFTPLAFLQWQLRIPTKFPLQIKTDQAGSIDQNRQRSASSSRARSWAKLLWNMFGLTAASLCALQQLKHESRQLIGLHEPAAQKILLDTAPAGLDGVTDYKVNQPLAGLCALQQLKHESDQLIGLHEPAA